MGPADPAPGEGRTLVLAHRRRLLAVSSHGGGSRERYAVSYEGTSPVGAGIPPS